MDNYYKILGVKDFAPMDEIKIAYKKLAMKFHPDVNDGDVFFEERFKEINRAYEILSEPSSKKSFDENWIKILQIIVQYLTPQNQEENKSTASRRNVRRTSTYIYVRGKLRRRGRL